MITFKRHSGSLTLERLKDLIAELKVEETTIYDDPTLNVKATATLYKVYALGNGSCIDKTEITTAAVIKRPHKDSSLFIYPQGEELKYNHYSLRDIGIIDNVYNDHQTFESPIFADLFLQHCKKNPSLEKRVQKNWRDMDSWNRDWED
jgi:hypothetical protein